MTDTDSRQGPLSEDELELLLDLSPDLICLAGTDGHFKYLNHRFEEVLGWTSEEMMGREAMHWIHPDDVQRTIDALGELAAGKSVIDFVNRYRTSDGTYRWFEWRAVPTRGGSMTAAVARDVTDRHHRDLEYARIRAALERSPDAAYIIRPDASIEYVNPAAANLLGYTTDELRAKTVIDINAHMAPDEWPAIWKRVTDEHKIVINTEHMKADGTAIPVEIMSYHLRFDDEDYACAFARETTERRRVEHEIQSRDRLMMLLLQIASQSNASIDAQLDNALRLTTEALDLDLGIISCIDGETYQVDYVYSRQGGIDAGITLDLGTTYCAITVEADDVIAIDHMGTSQFRGHPCYELRTLETYIAAPIKPAGCPPGTINFSAAAPRDEPFKEYEKEFVKLLAQWVTTMLLRRRSEEQLREGRERLDLALRGGNLGVWDRNMKNGEVVYNERWATMLGFDPDDIAPEFDSWVSRVHPDDLPAVRAALEAHLRGETETYEAEYRMQTKNGEWKWIQDRGLVVERTEEGDPVRITGTHLDVTVQKTAETERIELERRIQESQKLESLGVLAGGIAHDFNNLLMSILGNTDLAADLVDGASPAQPHLRDVLSASKRAAELCRQMLAYSGKGRFVIETVTLADLVREMTQMLEVSISKKAELKLELRDETCPVKADATQIRQVVMNLITNASESLENKPGVIRLTTGCGFFDDDYLGDTHLADPVPAGHYSWVEVSDTGSGMEDGTRSRMFDPFYTTKFTGRGLGMAATLGIVRGHSGALRVDSVVGEGTVIRVLLPSVSKATSSADRVAEEDDAHWTGSGTILLVDDEAEVRDIASQMLRKLGFDIIEARDGIEALRAFRDNRNALSCILLDLTMPRMDGDSALTEIRRLDSTIPVVLSSGYNQQDVTSRFVGRGMTAFIQKPYQLASLRKTLREITVDGIPRRV